MLIPFRQNMRRALVALILITALFPISTSSEVTEDGGIIIEEILVSASSAQYNGTDWNGDGDIGSYSDQYIMITNTGNQSVDISDWILDDTTAVSYTHLTLPTIYSV